MKRLKFLMAGWLFASLVAVTVVKVNPEYGAPDTGSLNLTNAEVFTQEDGVERSCVLPI